VAARSLVERIGRGASPFAGFQSGPFAAWTADTRGGSALDAGYTWKGRVTATARHTASGTSWAANVSPWRALSLGVTGDHAVTSAQGRVSVGPAWGFVTYAPGQVQLDGLVQLGPVAFYASSRDAFAITLRGPVALQVGRTGQVNSVRFSVGPFVPSPFVVPVVPR